MMTGSYVWIRKKQMIISVHEVEEIIDKFKLKSFEGGYKVLVMTKIEKMNDRAANKFLKFLEEPPEKLLFYFWRKV